jgi:hypothetical protein
VSAFGQLQPVDALIELPQSGHSLSWHRVTAPPGLKFITSDQPVINTYAAFIDEDMPVDDLELYFPVSPTHAAIISSHHAYQNTHGKELDAFRVNYLNHAMELQAHDQLFASTKEELQILASTFK